MRIVRIATIPFVAAHHLESQIRATLQAGHEVHVVTGQGDGSERLASLGATSLVHARIEREITPLADLAALAHLWRIFGRLRPDLIHSVTPKAGLLAAIAGWLRRVPIRLHTFTGQAWAERTGMVRWLSKAADRLIVRLNTRCYADSLSQRDFLVAEGICRAEQLHVMGAGSLAGIDLARFNLARLEVPGTEARARLGIAADKRVIVFLGRVNRDKGIGELVEAFTSLRGGVVLVLVGPFEPERDPLPARTLAEIRRNPAILVVGYDAEPERYLAFADVLCLPSYREGFGIVVLEAAALGVPCVGTRIVGLIDAVVDGVTGLLVPPKDTAALALALQKILQDDTLRRSLGSAARERAQRDFDARVFASNLLREYDMLAARRRALDK